MIESIEVCSSVGFYALFISSVLMLTDFDFDMVLLAVLWRSGNDGSYLKHEVPHLWLHALLRLLHQLSIIEGDHSCFGTFRVLMLKSH